jgi:hypothetical protein
LTGIQAGKSQKIDPTKYSSSLLEMELHSSSQIQLGEVQKLVRIREAEIRSGGLMLGGWCHS